MKPDEYLNGWAKKCGWKATLVYDSLWRHADRARESFPSIKLIAEEHGVGRKTIMKGVKTLVEFGIIKKEQKRSNKGKFLHNTYILLDKKYWKEPTEYPERDTDDRVPLEGHTEYPERDTKGTHKKGTHIIYSNGKPIAGKDINKTISYFEPVNPNYERIFSNKTQRESLIRMIKKHGYEKMTMVIKRLPEIINKPYAPRITTPYQLEQKLGELIAFMNQETGKKKGGFVDGS